MDQENDPNANKDMQNQNEQERNMVNEINDGLNSLRDLSRKLRVTREPNTPLFSELSRDHDFVNPRNPITVKKHYIL